MTKPIYVASYRTESGDEGVLGYWTTYPTDEHLTTVFKAALPDEFETCKEGEYRMVWWDVWELDEEPLPEPSKLVKSI